MTLPPLRLALLWHMHQPYYESAGAFLLPWARLHATKDYVFMAETVRRFPDLRVTFNLVPSLVKQLDEYASGAKTDRALRVSRIPADQLSHDDKRYILRQFFLCNVERMILPYERYAQLYEMAGRGKDESDDAIARFWNGDWLDLQVWYTLTWIDPYAMEREPFASALRKGRGFTEEEKHAILDASLEIVREVVPIYRSLAENAQAELTPSPFYHPILPLLCDSRVAEEARQGVVLPHHHIRLREDAVTHVHRAIDAHEKHFGVRPHGMWPSEGSVSKSALRVIREAGISWAATDQEILRRTLRERWHELYHCFPWSLDTGAGRIRLFFRDTELSDVIGFVYASWDPKKAARDFVERLLDRRGRIVEEFGVEGLRESVLPVVLDGENCWETYEENGRPFLNELYRLLTASKEIRTVTFSQTIAEVAASPHRRLEGIHAGSWIGGDFRIWIGHREDNLAWDALAEARHAVAKARKEESVAHDVAERAMEELYVAEGSDWFWWYGEENFAEDEDVFDTLFRARIMAAYDAIGIPHPSYLDHPIRNPALRTRQGAFGAMHMGSAELPSALATQVGVRDAE